MSWSLVGMKFPLRSIFIVAGSLLILHSAGLSFHYLIYRKIAVEYIRERQYHDRQNDTSTLVFGDSRPVTDFDPRLFPGSFNYGVAGASYTQIRYLLERKQISSPRKIKTIILQLDPHSFSSYRSERMFEEPYWADFVDYDELGKIRNNRLGYFGRAIKYRFFPYLGSGYNAIALLSGEESNGPLFSGYLPKPGDFSTNPERPAQTRSRALFHFGGKNPLDRIFLDDFSRIITRIAKMGITPLLVRFPVSRDYDEAIRSIIDPDLVIDKALKRIEGHDVRYLDCSSWFKDTPEYFADMDHLNPEGAGVFTSRLYDNLMER